MVLASAPGAVSIEAPRLEKMSFGEVELIIEADPAKVHLGRDILLTIKTIAPSRITVALPPLDDRLSGFALSGAFDREAVVHNGVISREHCFRLTPLIAAEYRLGPLAVTYSDTSQLQPVKNWFATRALVFEVAPLGGPPPGDTIGDIRAPVWVYPDFKTVALWAGAAALLAAALLALYQLGRRLRRAIRLRRMSPRERALYELTELLKQKLIARNLVKAFFLELTMIVRRYIERAHRLKAPEQTTEEFLQEAADNPQFRPEVLRKLRAFLQTADLVKFAAYRPEPAIIERALLTAKDYLETDEQLLATDSTSKIKKCR